MDEDRDLAVALQLQEKFNSEAGNVGPARKERIYMDQGKVKRADQGSLVDTTWEYIDPTPDIHSMFQLFDKRFFWGRLCGVEVKWSKRMTTCAGICCYEGRGGLCSVRLSAPLLKLRPRKDLVETLLHEMIHAYLFVTNNNRDRDGHGPEFHKHKNRINKEAGTKITVYHNFHDEVKFYQQHWWRCNGPCQSRPPFFGLVRRASNRAPGPKDFWWDKHRATCGGTFGKIKEPEGFKSKTNAATAKGASSLVNNNQDIRSFFPNQTSVDRSPVTLKDKNQTPGGNMSTTGTKNNIVGFKDLAVKESNSICSTSQASDKEGKIGSVSGKKVGCVRSGKKVGGVRSGKEVGGGRSGKKINGIGEKKLGNTGGMLANKGGGTLVVTAKIQKPNNMPVPPCSSKNIFVPFGGAGHVLGSGTVHSVGVGSGTRVGAATKRSSGASTPTTRTNWVSPTKKVKENSNFDGSHLKPFVTSPNSPDRVGVLTVAKESSCDVIEITDSPVKSDKVQCPVCGRIVDSIDINNHLDDCVEPASREGCSLVHCPVCDEQLAEEGLSQHLETCVGSVFSDENNGDEADESTDELYPCPCCMTWVAPQLMNQHLDECLSFKMLTKFADCDNC